MSTEHPYVCCKKLLPVKAYEYLISLCGPHFRITKSEDQGHMDSKQIFLQTWGLKKHPKSYKIYWGG